MNNAKWIIGILAVVAISYFILKEMHIIAPKGQESEVIVDAKKAVVKKRYTDDGDLKGDVTIVNGVRHGVAHNYYADGSVHSEIFYKHGKKDSISTWFYEDGTVYRTTSYKNGKKHGMQKKYYRNGTLMAEIPYENDNLQPGTNEYTEIGNLVSTEFKLNYNTINKTAEHEIVIVEVSGKKLNKIIDFRAFVKHSGNKVNGNRNENSIHFHVPSKPGNYKTIELVVWLTVKTSMNNKKIIEKVLTVQLGKE